MNVSGRDRMARGKPNLPAPPDWYVKRVEAKFKDLSKHLRADAIQKKWIARLEGVGRRDRSYPRGGRLTSIIKIYGVRERGASWCCWADVIHARGGGHFVCAMCGKPQACCRKRTTARTQRRLFWLNGNDRSE